MTGQHLNYISICLLATQHRGITCCEFLPLTAISHFFLKFLSLGNLQNETGDHHKEIFNKTDNITDLTFFLLLSILFLNVS